MVITDSSLCKGSFENRLSDLFRCGVQAIQLREKSLSAAEVLKHAVKAGVSATKYGALLMINDRIDIAKLSGCRAIHSPSAGVPNSMIKKYIRNSLSGRSVHSVSEAKRAQKEGYDYLLFGPVYRTPAKVKFGKPQGLQKLKEVCCSVNIPVFAVGGINPARALKCLQAGAYGVAGIRDFMTSGNIINTVSSYRKVLGSL